VLPASERVAFDALAAAAGAREARLALADEFVHVFPNCEQGAMPPFGQLYGLPVYVAETLAEDEEIAFNAGSFTEVIQMKYVDFARLARPTVLHVSLPTPTGTW
jgi:Ala-tRNA(Pro) deacylase